MSPEGGCGARRPGPSGGFLLLGIQVLYVLLDPRQLGVATELLALPGGEDHSCLGADAPVGKLVAYHSALRNFLGNEGNATGRGECHGVCRGDAQGQEEEAGCHGHGPCHILESREGSSGLTAGRQEENSWDEST